MSSNSPTNLPAPIAIAVTLGDPAGIGPEIVARVLAGAQAPDGLKAPADARLLVVGAARHIQRALSSLDVSILLETAEAADRIDWTRPGVKVIEPPRGGGWPDVAPGAVCAEGGEAAFQAVALAARLALEGRVDAICTAPLHKKALNLAGHAYPGHTEILADIARVDRVVMLLQGGGLRVTMVTIHTALSDVPRLVTEDNVLGTIRVTDDALRRDWGIAAPRIAVTGLNPHAGDQGLLGREELTAIAPAIHAARALGVGATGPWPADTVFHRMLQGEYDAVVAMYHDQALAALKTVAFDEGVNITLGLPFIRTSVDHGTAMDIAGQNRANPRSLLCALRDAAELARARRRTRSA